MFNKMKKSMLTAAILLISCGWLWPTDTITVTSPNGGELWEVGSTQSITWTSTGTMTEVKIWYSTDNGNNWITIKTSTENDGSHDWTIPDTSSPNCLIRIGDLDHDPDEVSAGTFHIIKTAVSPFTAITSGDIVTDALKSYGAAWGDYDNDGDPDLFVANYTDEPNSLYQNNGDGTFTKITTGDIVSDVDASIGASWGDYDNDNDLDLFVANIGSDNFLYRNNGDGTFTKITSGIIVSDGGNSRTGAWVDYDNDGDLDLFVANRDETNRLYKNNGDGTFEKITSGNIVIDSRASLGGYWGDYDNDGYPDLLVVNYSMQDNDLYHNNGDGTFTRVTGGVVVSDGTNSIGACWGDYDNDNDLDLYVAVDGGINLLYRNDGGGAFQKITSGAPVTDVNASRSPCWVDVDNDGDLDLFVTNKDENNCLYRNEGGAGFTKITSGALVSDGGSSIGCSWADYNNDGYPDLFAANNSTQTNFLYQNDGSSNHWLTVRCLGSDHSAINTKVKVKAMIHGLTVWQLREINAQSGAYSQNSTDACFGLADAAVVEEIRIEWPSGEVQTSTNVTADQVFPVSIHPTPGIEVTAPNGGEHWQVRSSQNITWTNTEPVTNVKIEYSINNGATYTTIIESTENDGLYEWDIPETPAGTCRVRVSDVSGTPMDTGNFCFAITPIPISTAFTRITDDPIVNETGGYNSSIWGDYDNDGYPDMFLSNWYDQTNYLFHNKGDGTFEKVTTGPIVGDGNYSSNTSGSWADYDNDGDLDLYVTRNEGRTNFLYRNDGGDTFTKITSGALVTDYGHSNSPNWVDYDNDGDLDLFVANKIGYTNHLYRNNGDGTFTSVTSGTIVNDSETTNSSSWCDYDNDGDLDLFLAKTYGINNSLYQNNGDETFTKITTGPVVTDGGISCSGTWGDYNNDGYADLFVANLSGNNFLYRNNGDGTFTKITSGPVVNQGGGGDSYSGLWFDYDNDGDLDLFVTNKDQGCFIFQNHGNETFTQDTDFELAGFSGNLRGISSADYDRDGDLDLFVVHNGAQNLLYRNNGNGNHWVQIRCIGNTSNRSAIGAKVWVQATIDGNPVWQVREISSQDGYKVQNSMIAHFGLGDAAVMDELRVEWPSGNIQTLHNVNADQLITITETSGTSSIVVTSPNGGQTWEGDTLHTITWLSSGSITNVNIEYSTDNGGAWNTIAASAPNTGSYIWTVPSSASAQCLVRVSDAGGSAADASDAVFTIIVPTITVTAPNGGELWDVGTTPNITWNTIGTVGNVKVEYSTDNGSTYNTIIDSTVNDGTYVWTVPDEVSPSCRVRISAVSGGVSDVSDNVFAIVPIVNITAPVNGNEWTAGSTYSITWTCSGTMANVTLEYSLNNGTTYTAVGTTGNDGTYEWLVPDVYSPESRVRILDMGDNELDVSETFTIRRTIDPNTFEKITGGAVVNDGGKSFRCSFGDYDNDGYMDLFVGNWDYQNNFLYHNNGDGTFTKITSGSVVTDGGKTLGGVWGDYDGDEDLDLFVCNNSYTNNFLYRNNGDGTFTKLTNSTSFPMVTGGGHTYSGNWVDYDNDNDLDLFAANRLSANFLYRNNGDSTFTKITSNAIASDTGSTLNSVWSDYDNDGDMDLFLTNFDNQDDALYRNNGDGSFTKITSGPVSNDGISTGGAAWGDYDNDGYQDLYVCGNSLANFLYHNEGDGTFTKITSGDIVTDVENSRGVVWGDLDNDGDLDLFVANSSQNNSIYWNEGNGNFNKMTAGIIVTDGGASAGCSAVDYDRDGDLDIFVTNGSDENNFLYRNTGNSHNWVQVLLTGTDSNRSGIGAKVKVQAIINGTSVWQYREITGQSGYMDQNSLVAHFGLGDAAIIEEIRVEWPSGNVKTLTDVNVNQFLTINEAADPATITVAAPNGGETLTEGSTYTITWTSTGTVGDIMIDYSLDNGSTYSSITASTENDGSFDWTVPGSASSSCLIRVKEVSSEVSDVSDAVFMIVLLPPDTVTVISPNGGESWEAGTNQAITWSSSGAVSNVRIEFSSDSGTSWADVVASTPNSGSYNWTVPANGSANCLIRISDIDSDPADVSDGVFTIVLPSISVTAPQGGENWEAGSLQSITWTSIGSIANVKIEYSTDNGAAWADIIASTANSGSYNWTVPANASAQCLIRVSDIDSDPADVSDGVFTIVLPSISVTAPQGGENWEAGSLQSITWTSVGSIANVKIEYSTDNGATWADIIASTANSGSYDWTIPNTPSTNCLVRISDTDGDPVDTSDTVFTITLPTIAVTAPNGGENWDVGSIHPITWTSAGDIANVKIEYSTDNGTTWADVIASTANSGSYDWTIPNTPSANCLVRISDTDGDPVDTSDTVFTITLPTIAVTTPNGGENWDVGSTHPITWTSAGTIPNIKIEYSTDNGATWADIIASTANSGSYDWTIPNTPSTNCLVRISDTDGDPVDTSDTVFTITLPTITVTAPNGGENWDVGSTHPITWTSAGTIPNIKIKYSTDNGTTWADIIASTANSGSYDWTIPNTPSSNCLVRVSDTDGDPVDASDAVFTITVPTITVTAPNGGENWDVGSTQSITWTSAGTIDNIKIEYSTDNGSTWIEEAASALNNGSYNWIIPNTPSTQCLVRVSDSDGDPVDTSDAAFTITLPTITVTAPNGGENWDVGSTHPITWTSAGTIPNIKIEYSTDNGTTWADIIASTANSGSYDWTMPNTPSTTCLVKISDTDGDPVDTSDAVFTITLPTITVTAPNGGENWDVGSIHPITWTSAGTIDNVKIEYSTDNGTTWADVIASTANSGSYDWTIPNTPSSNCLVKISDADGDPVDTNDAVFTITLPTIAVTAPNGGENWDVGSTYPITWTSAGDIPNVKIEYSTDNGTTWADVIASTANSGSYDWTVPNAPSSNCLVRVSDIDGDPVDTSDAVFTIIVPGISVTTPNGGEDWDVGTTQAITWTSTGTIDNVKIEYSTDNGGTWIEESASAPNNGSYDWNIPNTPSTQCLVKVSDTDDNPADTSDAVFTITLPTISVTSPNGGETLVKGANHDITWTSTGIINNISIDYSTDNGSTWTQIIDTTENDGLFPWTVPDVSSNNCKIRISDADNSNTNDVSDAVFTISDPIITVTYPSGGENLERGKQVDIQWTTLGISQNLKLILLQPDGTPFGDIITDIPISPTKYTWTVGQTSGGMADNGSGYKVRIKTMDDIISTDSSAFNIIAAQVNISVQSPANNALVNTPTVTISGQVDGIVPTTVNIDAINADIIGNSFYFNDFSLTAGANSLLIHAEDAYGNTAETTLNLTLDTIAPVLNVSQPVNGSTISERSTVVQGTVTDEFFKELRVNGVVCTVTNDAFTTAVALNQGTNTIQVIAEDTAGNTETVTIMVTCDDLAPVITVTGPDANAYVNTSPVTITGRAEDADLAGVNVNGAAAALDGNQFTKTGVTLVEGENQVTIEAADSAGNQSTKTHVIYLDTQAPQIDTVFPAQDAVGVPVNTPVQVTLSETIDVSTLTNDNVYLEDEDQQKIAGTLQLNGTVIRFTAATALPENQNLRLVVTAGLTDLAGNALSNPYNETFTTVDDAAPAKPTVEALPEQTSQTSIILNGTGENKSKITVTGGASMVNTTCDEEDGDFSVEVPLKENSLNQLLVTASDEAGNTSAPASVFIYQESIEFLVLSAQLSGNLVTVDFSKPVNASTLNQTSSFKVSDESTTLTGTITLSTDQEQVTFDAGTSLEGSVIRLDITTAVTDTENKALAYPYTRVFNQSGMDVIVQGEVYDDDSGLLLGGAMVTLVKVINGTLPSPAPATVTTVEGSYVLAIPTGQCVLRITKEGYTHCDRLVHTVTGGGVEVFDARIRTRDGEEQTLPTTAATLFYTLSRVTSPTHAVSEGEETAALVCPEGSVSTEKNIRVTGIGGQGVQGRLPLGWSPLAAVDIRENAGTPDLFLVPVTLRVKNHWPSATGLSLVLAHWDETLYEWQAQSMVSVSAEELSGTLQKAGQYVFLIRDTSPAVPGNVTLGQAVPAVSAGSIPADTEIDAALAFVPGEILPEDVSLASLTITAKNSQPANVSSGTAVQAKISESYQFLNQSTVDYRPYTADLTVYNYGTDTSTVTFGVSANRKVSVTGLDMGTIQADMVRFSEAGTGDIVDENGGEVSYNGASITIPAGAVPYPIAVSIDTAEITEAIQGFTVVGAVELSLSGVVLSQAATLSVEPIEGVSVSAGDPLVLVRLGQTDLGYGWILEARCTVDGTDVITMDDAALPFPGVKHGGTYYFLKADAGIDYIKGTVSYGGTPLVGGMVTIDDHDLAAFSGPEYVQVGFQGSAVLTALHPDTRDQVQSGEQTLSGLGNTVTLDLAVAASGPQVASVSPINGSTDVSAGTTIIFTFTEPVDAASFNSTNVEITCNGTAVAGLLRLSEDGQRGEFIPNEHFPPGGQVNVRVKKEITDPQGNNMGLVDFTSTFSVMDVSPLAVNPDDVKIIIPVNGLARVTSEGKGILDTGDSITVVNLSNGKTAALTAQSDDTAFDVSIAAEWNHTLQIFFLDAPEGRRIDLPVKPFVSEDGSRIVLGDTANSFINSANGLGLEIEDGTFSGPVEIGLYEETDFTALAVEPTGYQRLKALKVAFSGGVPGKGVTLSLPVPDGLASDAKLFIAREVSVFGEKKLMVVAEAVVVDGRVKAAASELFNGCMDSGTYSLIENQSYEWTYISGTVSQPGLAVVESDFAFVTGHNSSEFTIPVPIGRTVEINVRDLDTGESSSVKSISVPAIPGDIYQVGKLSNDHEPPMLMGSTGVGTYAFSVTSGKVTSQGFTIEPAETSGPVENVKITGDKNTTVNVEEQIGGTTGDSSDAPGKILIYKMSEDTLQQMETFDANADGSFPEKQVPAQLGDRLMICVEKGNVPVNQEFVLTFSEPVKEFSTGDNTIKIKTVGEIPEEIIDVDVDFTENGKKVTVKPLAQLKEGTRYILEINNLEDHSGNSLSFNNYFRTFRSVTLGSENISGLDRIYNSVRYGKYLYAATGDSGVRIMDVSDPAAIHEQGVCPQGSSGRARGLAIYKTESVDYLVVVGGENAARGFIQLLNISDPVKPVTEKIMFISDAPVMIVGNKIDGVPQNVKVVDKYAFVPVLGAGVLVIDLDTMKTGPDENAYISFFEEEGVLDVRPYYWNGPMNDQNDLMAVLLVDRFGIRVVDYSTITAPHVKGSYANNNNNIVGGLEFAQDYGVDANGDNEIDFFEKNDVVVFSERTAGTVHVVDITDPDNPFLMKQIDIDNSGGIVDVVLDENQKKLTLTDLSLGFVLVDMDFSRTGVDEPESRIIGTVKTSGSARDGVFIDKDLNIAYVGQEDKGVDVVKLGNPTVKLVQKFTDAGTGKVWYEEVNRVAPSGVKDAENLGEFPEVIYVLAYLPAGKDNLTVTADVWSLNASGARMVPAGNNANTYIKDLPLVQLSSDPGNEYYNTFLSEPVTVTLKPHESQGTRKLLSGDWLYVHLSQGVAGAYSNYLSGSDCLEASDRKPSVRADLVDRVENFEQGQVEKPAGPLYNPSMYQGVLLHSCELVFDDVDLHIPGRGFDFVFQRTYRSKALYSGVLGWNWDHNYNKRLLMWSNGDVIYYDGSGRRERYVQSSTPGQYTAPAGRFTQLRRLEDGSFRLVFAQGVVEFFDVFGRLVKIQDRNKNKMEFYYGFSGQLSTVMDTMGRLIHFEYNEYEFDTNGNVKPGSLRLSKIRDFDGRSVEFDYDVNTGDLTKVSVGIAGETDESKRRIKQYGYSQNGDIKLAHNLENYIDPRGSAGEGTEYPQGQPVLTVQYDANDKVLSQTWDDAQTSFVSDGSAATVTDARNNEKTIAYNTDGQVESVSEGAHTTHFVYDTLTGLPDTVTYPRGNSVKYDYAVDSNLVTKVTELPGGLTVDDSAETQRVTTFDYEYFTNNLKSVTSPNGLKQNYNYNEYGQLVSQYRSFDGTTLGMTTTYEYYAETAPGGDGTANNSSPRELDNLAGGYLKKAARSLGVISNWTGQLYNEFTYDIRGNVNKVDSSSGIATTYQVDEFDNVEYEETVSTDSYSPLTYNASFDYDKIGNVKNRITNFGLGDQRISNSYEYTYTKRNMLHEQKETAKGMTTNYTYDKNDNIQQVFSTNAGAGTLDSMSFTYNARDLVETVQMGSDLASSAFSYDGNGNIQTYTNRFGHVHTYEYDGYDRMRAVTDPLNQRTEILRFDMGDRLEVKEYDSASNLLRETVTVQDPLGRMKDYTVKMPDSADEQYAYQYQQAGDQLITTTTDSLGRTWTVIKNDKGQVVEESGPGGSTQYGYVYSGRRLTKVIKTDTENKPDNTDETYVTEYYYNDFNKVWKIVENPGTTEEFITELFYDVKGNLKESKDAEGNVISHEYDDFGRKTRTKKRFSDSAKPPITTEFTYYENDLLKTVKDDKGNVTSYEYDDQKRLKKVTYPDNSFIGYAYTEKLVNNKKYRVVTETQRNGTVVTNDYDELNRLKTRTITRAAGVGGTTSETYEYDGLSRLWKAINDDFTVEREYDTLNRLMREKQMGKWIDYSYGIEDNRRKMTVTYPNGRIIEHKFDVLDRLMKVREGVNDLAGYEYIGRGYRYSKKELNNGDVTNYLYDQGRRLTSIEARNINSDLINKYVYGYNKVHMKMFEERGHDSNKGDVYDYDEFQRLTGVKFNSPEPQVHETTQFEKSWSAQYDKVDNILSIVETENQTTNEITPTMDEDNAKLNQYTTFDQWGLSYDQNGNTTQKGTQSFTYDYRSQLVSATDGTTSADYKYDALGRRVQKIVTTGTQTDTFNYYYSGNRVIEERDGSDAVLKQYVYGNGIDELLIIVNFDGATQTDFYVHTNSIGSVTAITDQDGNLVERVSYDTFGMPTFTDYQTDPQNPTVVSDSLIGNDILFQGRRYDEETNLYYYRARYYDPIMGRFLQTDPIGYRDSMNLYQAFNMNGVNYLDPSGKMIEISKDDIDSILTAIKIVLPKEVWKYIKVIEGSDKDGLKKGHYYIDPDLVKNISMNSHNIVLRNLLKVIKSKKAVIFVELADYIRLEEYKENLPLDYGYEPHFPGGFTGMTGYYFEKGEHPKFNQPVAKISKQAPLGARVLGFYHEVVWHGLQEIEGKEVNHQPRLQLLKFEEDLMNMFYKNAATIATYGEKLKAKILWLIDTLKFIERQRISRENISNWGQKLDPEMKRILKLKDRVKQIEELLKKFPHHYLLYLQLSLME